MTALNRWPLLPDKPKRWRKSLPANVRGVSAADQAATNVSLNSFGLDPITGTAATDVLQLFDGIDFDDVPEITFMADLLSELTMGDSSVSFDIPAIRERLSFASSNAASQTSTNTLSDGVVFEEALHVAWSLMIAEGISLAGTVASQPYKLGAVVDAMVAAGVTSSRLEAIAAVAAAMTMQSLVSNGWSAEAVDAAIFEESLTQNVQFVKSLLDSIEVADAVGYGLTMTAIVNDSIAVGTALSVLAQLNAEASEQVLLYSSLRLGAATFDGWVVNHKLAASQYTNYPFESLAYFGGRGYGAGEGGIFRMGGDEDDGEPIEAYVRTGLSDLGTSKLKNVPEAFFGIGSEGRIVVKTITTSATGSKVEDWYVQKENPGNAPREGFIKLGPGVESRYWQFELHNKEGGELDVSDFRFTPMFLSRRK
jgi:hypothetical protein